MFPLKNNSRTDGVGMKMRRFHILDSRHAESFPKRYVTVLGSQSFLSVTTCGQILFALKVIQLFAFREEDGFVQIRTEVGQRPYNEKYWRKTLIVLGKNFDILRAILREPGCAQNFKLQTKDFEH